MRLKKGRGLCIIEALFGAKEDAAMQRIRQKLEKLLTTDQFSYEELKKMFLTLLLDQFFIFAIGVLSTMLVSRVGEAAMAAVSLVGTINGMVSLVFTSLATGGAIAVSRAKGRGDTAEIQRAIGEVTGVCGLVSIVLGALLYAGADAVVHLLYPNVEPLVTDYAVRYMRMMCISFVHYSIFNAIFNVFRNLGDTRSSLLLTIVINVSHLLLSLLFINIMDMGVMGSGLSYIVARAIGMVLALFWLLVVHNTYHVRAAFFFRFSAEVTKDIFSLGMPLAVESMLLQGGMLIVNIYLAQLTTMEMAAHARANALMSLYNTTLGALISLTSTVCGQCFGAKRYDLTLQYGNNLIKVGRFAMAITSLILYPLTPVLMMMYNVPPESMGTIYLALAIAAVGMPLFACDSNITAMVLRVAGDGVFTGACAVISLALCRCILGYVLTIVVGLGVPGVWIALAAEWLLRAVAQHLRLRGNNWIHQKA